jgi:hypothetical protein
VLAVATDDCFHMGSGESYDCLGVDRERVDLVALAAEVDAAAAVAAVGAVVAELGSAAVAADSGCSEMTDIAAPIPKCVLGELHHPVQQISKAPSAAGCHSVENLVACSALCAVDRGASSPASSSPLPASYDPPQLWRAAMSS